MYHGGGGREGGKFIVLFQSSLNPVVQLSVPYNLTGQIMLENVGISKSKWTKMTLSKALSSKKHVVLM